MKTLAIIATALLLVSSDCPLRSAQAQSRNYYDAHGRKLGSSTVYGNTTRYYDRGGSPSGTATTSPSGVTTYRDKTGRIQARTSGR